VKDPLDSSFPEKENLGKSMLRSLLFKTGLAYGSCAVCGGALENHSQGFLCFACLREIKPAPVLFTALPYVKSCRVFAPYGGVLAETLRLIKFRSVKPLAGFLGERISPDLKNFAEEVSADVLTFVPVHFLRRWTRGFDHNREILRGSRLPYEELLIRVRHSKPLIHYGREERFRKVESAFSLREGVADRVEGKRILVFDDVLTTGATATSVARLLLTFGADSVSFYFLSREG